MIFINPIGLTDYRTFGVFNLCFPSGNVDMQVLIAVSAHLADLSI